MLLYMIVCFQVNRKSCFHYSGFRKVSMFDFPHVFLHILTCSGIDTCYLEFIWWCSNFLHVFVGCILYIISLFFFYVKTLYALTSMWNWSCYCTETHFDSIAQWKFVNSYFNHLYIFVWIFHRVSDLIFKVKSLIEWESPLRLRRLRLSQKFGLK